MTWCVPLVLFTFTLAPDASASECARSHPTTVTKPIRSLHASKIPQQTPVHHIQVQRWPGPAMVCNLTGKGKADLADGLRLARGFWQSALSNALCACSAAHAHCPSSHGPFTTGPPPVVG